MDKHTPGPWTVVERDVVGAEFFIVPEGREIYQDVASGIIDHHDHYTPDTLRANARLMASAPEQHNLLNEALDLVPRMSEDDPIAPALAEWCQRVRAVVAKARGAA